VDSIESVRVRAREGDSEVDRTDDLAVEEPLEIRIAGPGEDPAARFVTTMRTPGSDEELAAGLLLAEGVLAERSDLVAIGRPEDPRMAEELKANSVIVRVSEQARVRAARLARGTVMGSACGVCGKTSIENVIPVEAAPLASRLRVTPDFLYALPVRLRERQSIFSRTGGLHAAALFRPDGELATLREDIGRHNATDKVVGHCFLGGRVPVGDGALMVSGRAGFEIVQKAYNAGIPIVAAVSAPSSLAVDLADATGITLIGFLRDRRFNVYTHSQRVAAAGSS